MNILNRIKAFTLAEVLITLMIIGILAVITIPSILQSWEEQATVSKLKKVYSVLQQAYQMAEQEYGTPDTWTLTNDKIWDNLVPSMNVLKYCRNKPEGCFFDGSYKNISDNPYTAICANGNFENCNAGKIMLKDGTSIVMTTINSKCQGLLTKGEKSCAYVIVDVNGPKPPNKLRNDTFFFSLTKKGFIPWGGKAVAGYEIYSHDYYCNHDHGHSCARWVIERGNMDYLHKVTNW